MAKNPPPRKAPATKAPVKGGRGRPAGLFTWVAIGLVVVVVATLVIIKVSSGSSGGGGGGGFQAADAATVADLTGVPTTVFDTVGVTSSVAGVTAPIKLTGQPALTAKTSTGATVPLVVYVGAEYCPFCAAERWALIIALSRFGTWSGLGNMESSTHTGEIYPGTPTFTFLKAHFTSPYVAFSEAEINTNQWSNSLNFYTPLQAVSKAQNHLVSTYDVSKFTHSPSTNDHSIPFIDFGNRFMIQGSSYTPSLLANQSRTQIATGLKDPSSPVSQAIIATANYLTAAICATTSDQPASVCSSKGVAAAKKVMGVK